MKLKIELIYMFDIAINSPDKINKTKTNLLININKIVLIYL